MVQRKPANRLGYNGINEIKDHPWLKYYPWRDLYEKKLEAPFLPKNLDNYDKKYCEGPDKIGNDTLERYQNYYKNEALNDVFINYSFENLLTLPTAQKESNNNLAKKAKSGVSSANPGNSQGQNVYFNNSSASPQKKRINSSLGAIAVNNKNASLNNLLKNKMKITESLYLNQPNNVSNNNNNVNFVGVNQSQNFISKPLPVKNRTSSLNMNSTNVKSNSILSPNHIRNMSSSSNLSVALNYKQNNNINNNNVNNLNLNNANNNFNASSTPNKNRSFNNLNILKSRGKNLSINSTANISNLTNIPASNISVNNNKNININVNASSSGILNLKQSSAKPYLNAQISEKTGSERLPFIEQKLANFRQFSSNLANAKKISYSPSLKNSAKNAAVNVNSNVNNGNTQQKSGGAKYSTLSASANSTGSSTVSMNFLHKRSGSTNTFNNY